MQDVVLSPQQVRRLCAGGLLLGVHLPQQRLV